MQSYYGIFIPKSSEIIFTVKFLWNTFQTTFQECNGKSVILFLSKPVEKDGEMFL